ncbi:MAG: hypothetical protein ACR652_23140 [Methylocystis sp.]|uniref:hypothetical protein n=1 Tax=Methylocystis sp. TaxID=1911079 RepID=UPI003DA677C2
MSDQTVVTLIFLTPFTLLWTAFTIAETWRAFEGAFARRAAADRAVAAAIRRRRR